MSSNWVQVLNLDVEAENARLDSAARGSPVPSPATVAFVVATTRDQRATGAALQLLAANLPFGTDFAHLKRVRKFPGGKIIHLLLVKFESEHRQQAGAEVNAHALLRGSVVSEAAEELCKLLDMHGHVVDVPAEAPLCQEEAKRWSEELWPVLFGQRITVASRRPALAPQLLNSVDAETSEFWVRKALSWSDAVGGKPTGLFVDQASGTLVAEGVSCADGCGHPLRHAAMVTIDAASAAIQSARRASESGQPIQPRDRSKQKRPKLEHAREGAEHCAVMAFFDPVKTYLCTGLDYYTSDEPCVMCAMALLHSRVRRVFFARNSPTNGALGSQLRLHCHPQLNHHFAVYKRESNKNDH